MDWLKTLVPLLGTALGGPMGGAAASFIADKLGIESKTIEAVTDVLNSGKMTPEQLTQIKAAEIDFKKFLETNKIDLARLDVDDRKSAREMQTAVHSNIPGLLAVIIVVGFFAILICMMLGILKTTDQESLLILLGALSAGFGAVLNFFFGSSHGSQAKDAMLANSAPVK
jgi:gas vesicle protein